MPARVLIVSYSGWRGRGHAAPRRRALVHAFRRQGLEPIFFGLPDTVEMLRWMGWRSLSLLAALNGQRALRLLRLRSFNTGKYQVALDVLEAIAIRRLERGDIAAVYTTKTFDRLLAASGDRGVPAVAEMTTGPVAGKRLPVGLRRATHAVTFNDVDRQVMIDAGLDADRVHAIWSLDREMLAPRAAADCPTVPRFIFTAYFKKRKRLEMALKAWCQRRVGDGEFHIVGPIVPEMVPLQEKYGARKDVVFHGEQNPMEFYTHLSAVGVVPSAREGLPRVMLEFMRCGFPVIVSAEASKGFVVDGISGRVLDPCTVDTLRDAFDAALLDYKRFWSLGAAGQERIRTLMMEGEFADRVAELVARTVASGAAHFDEAVSTA